MAAATCAVMCAATLLSALPASAQSTADQLGSARVKAQRVKAEYERIAEAYAQAEHNVARASTQMQQTRDDIAAAQDDMAGLKKQLRQRVRTAYQMRGVGFFQFLLEAQSFREFSLRLTTLQRQSLNDEGLILQLRRKRAELELRQRELRSERSVYQSEKAAYERQGRLMSISLSQANRLVADLKNQLTREQIAALFRVSRGDGGGGMSIPLDSCPVAGPHSVMNNWGAPRGGGTRRHQGNDIMGPYGTPLVAVVSGTVTRAGSSGDPNGGTYVYVFGAGTEYYYAHLAQLTSRPGQKVGAGQEVGTLGDSGNAKGGPPHLHFEIHPGGGAPIDPYPSLSAVC